MKLLIFLIPLITLSQPKEIQSKLDSCKTTVYNLKGVKIKSDWKDCAKGMYIVRINCDGKIEEILIYKSKTNYTP